MYKWLGIILSLDSLMSTIYLYIYYIKKIYILLLSICQVFFRKQNQNQNQPSPHPSHKPLFRTFTNTTDIYQVTSLQQYEYTSHHYFLLALLQLSANNKHAKYLIIMICPFAQKQAKQALLHMTTTSACSMKEASVMLWT